ncbi:packaged DNA stabilization protein [Burkholderia gladioli]|uniref:packaged DNA stabilization protein n=1 Tax=Burkholderia gladioli TaxID=28095 RepID=UPI00163F9867|nr:packaged DNA stabilization protein [Burkholderia gladioli]
MARSRVPLLVGSYQARSLIASAQRCVNLYMEANPKDSPFPTTHHLMPGLTLLAQVPEQGWRGQFTSSNGRLFGVCGNALYNIAFDASGVIAPKKLGTILTSSGPVAMNDNSVTLLLVDGTGNGYTVDLASLAFAQVSDPAFYGASRVDVVDGYFILNRPGTAQFYISLYQQVSFDSLDFAAKNGYSDSLVGSIVANRNIWLFGAQTAELWTNTGASDFTFSRMDGVFIQHGCAAVGSLQQMDGSVFFLARDPQGHAIIMRTVALEAKKISTFALDSELQSYPTIADATSYTFQVSGHMFYVLSFPTANKTWAYDLSSEQWTEWVYTDTNGGENRHRVAAAAFWNGMHVGGDYANGNLYLLDRDALTDNGAPIVRRRGFPHSVDVGNRVLYRELIADFEVGAEQSTYAQGDTAVYLRWSDTKGKTWSNPIASDLGPLGDYLRSVQFQRLGMARDRVFELFWSAPIKTALNGAFLNAQPVNE